MPIVIHYCHNYFVVFIIFSHFLHFKWNIFEYYCRNCLNFLSGIFGCKLWKAYCISKLEGCLVTLRRGDPIETFNNAARVSLAVLVTLRQFHQENCSTRWRRVTCDA